MSSRRLNTFFAILLFMDIALIVYLSFFSPSKIDIWDYPYFFMLIISTLAFQKNLKIGLFSSIAMQGLLIISFLVVPILIGGDRVSRIEVSVACYLFVIVKATILYGILRERLSRSA